MEWKVKDSKERKEMLDIYLKIFNLWDLNKTNLNEYKDLIKEFEKFGLNLIFLIEILKINIIWRCNICYLTIYLRIFH